MERTVNIAGKTVKLKASALTPRLYREKFGRDLLSDVSAALGNKLEFSEHVKVCENLAYIMAFHADPSIGELDEWLDKLDINAPYELMPYVLELWLDSSKTTAVAKKNRV